MNSSPELTGNPTNTIGRLETLSPQQVEQLEASYVELREAGIAIKVDPEVIVFSPDQAQFAIQAARDMSLDGQLLSRQNNHWPPVSVIGTTTLFNNEEPSHVILTTGVPPDYAAQLRHIRREHTRAQNARLEAYGSQYRLPVPPIHAPEIAGKIAIKGIRKPTA